jgi:4-hydroxybenzoate polyprenyltransferase
MCIPTDTTTSQPNHPGFLKSLKAYLDLCRVSNLPTVWTNVLAAFIISTTRFSWLDFLTLALSMSLFYSGGMCLNDICDAAPDRVKKPLRPIPSGRVSMRNSAFFTGVLFLSALVLLADMHFPRAIYGGLLLLLIIAAYDLVHKAHPLSVILMAGCRFLVFVITSLALTGALIPFVLAAGAIQFIYLLLICVVARYENSMNIPFKFPVIPAMLAGISLLDGVLMALFVSPAWLIAGIAGTVLTWYGQRFVRGD